MSTELITNDCLLFTFRNDIKHDMNAMSFVRNRICVIHTVNHTFPEYFILKPVTLFRCQCEFSNSNHKFMSHDNTPNYVQPNKPPSSIQLKNQIKQHSFEPKKAKLFQENRPSTVWNQKGSLARHEWNWVRSVLVSLSLRSIVAVEKLQSECLHSNRMAFPIHD